MLSVNIVNANLLLTIIRIVGFGPFGPIKGMVLFSCNTSIFLTFSSAIAAWLQGWLFGLAVPKGSGFAMLQRLAMTGKARL
ncbi:hypothetical protein C8R48DRAFT_302559 [Suillus tomentosus]|nr:hypothetical protein C8R48DRAFT_302559 [Suillus tomentosus]